MTHEKTHAAVTGEGSAISKYRQVVIGSDSFAALLYFEFCQLFSYVPGSFGMLARKIFWPRLFNSCGKGVVFGCGIVLRQPRRVSIGRSVVFSEYCVIDARHTERDISIIIGNDVIFSNNVMLSCKQGHIVIGDRVGINAQTIIQSTNDNEVVIGNDCVIGQGCFVVGGGNYDLSTDEQLVRRCPIIADGGISIADNVWLGGKVSVLGGVTMGEGSVAGAGAVVSRSIPPRALCLGVPARVVKQRP